MDWRKLITHGTLAPPRAPTIVCNDTSDFITQIEPSRLTIIIPCLNERKGIERWIGSFLNQTVLPFEVVICDGGSTDGTVEFLRSVKTPIGTTLKIVPFLGSNIAASRNRAVTESSGEILLFTDLGCELDPYWVERISRPFFANPNVQYVKGWYEPVIKSEFARGFAALLTTPRELIDPDVFLPSARSFAIRRPLYVALGGYPECLRLAGEDTLFDDMLMRTQNLGAFCPGAVVHWEMPTSAQSLFSLVYRYSFGDGEAARLFVAEYRNRIYQVLPVLLSVGVLFLSALWLVFLPNKVHFAIVLASGIACLWFGWRAFGGLAGVIRSRSSLSTIQAWCVAILFGIAQTLGFLRGFSLMAKRLSNDAV